MPTVHPTRNTARAAGHVCLAFVLLLAVFGAAGSTSQAQVAPYGEKTMGEPAQDQMTDLLQKIKIVQKLNAQLPLNAPFLDETGRQVTLQKYFGQRPVILALVYYQCPILCSEELRGLVSSLEMVKFNPGRDFDVVVISINPTEGPSLAKTQKALYVKRFNRPGTADGWHFLTGTEPSIRSVANAVGFHYALVSGPDGKLNQYAHSTAIEIVTPEGRVAQYYMGVEYSPQDLTLGLVEASHHKIGTVADNLMTYCYRYDPKIDRHSLAIVRLVQAACLLTAFGFGSFLLVEFRRDIQQGTEPQAGSTQATKG